MSSLNVCSLMGYMASNPTLNKSSGGTSYTSFRICVNRGYAGKGESNQQTADFFDVFSFGKTAEFICKYFKKGMPIWAMGEMQNCEYTTKDGEKRTKAQLKCKEAGFCLRQASGAESTDFNAEPPKPTGNSSIDAMVDLGDDALPW